MVAPNNPDKNGEVTSFLQKASVVAPNNPNKNGCEKDCQANSKTFNDHESLYDIFTQQPVCGSFHQGSSRFNPETRGQQCSCNSLVALCLLSKKTSITPDHLDDVLISGDALYQTVLNDLMKKNKFMSFHLSFDELPTTVNMLNVEHTITKHNSYHGITCGKLHDLMSLKEALLELFNEFSTGLLLVNSSVTALFKHNNMYKMFDPHSRDANGLPVSNGHSILLSFASVLELLNFLVETNGSEKQFELLPVSVVIRTPSVNLAVHDPNKSLMDVYFCDQISKQLEYQQNVASTSSVPSNTKRRQSLKENERLEKLNQQAVLGFQENEKQKSTDAKEKERLRKKKERANPKFKERERQQRLRQRAKPEFKMHERVQKQRERSNP